MNTDVFSLNPNFVPVLNAAYIKSFEMLKDILIAYPESAIRLILIFLNIGQTYCFL